MFQHRFKSFESQRRLLSICSYLKYRFEKEGMKHLAGLFDNYASNKLCYTCHWNSFNYSQIKYYDEQADVNDVEKLIQVFHKKKKNELESFLLLPYPHANHFYDVLSVLYLRVGNVQKALAAIQEINEEFWLSSSIAMHALESDPFTQNKELFIPQTLDRMGKKEILEKMVALESEAEERPDKRANSYFLLGNAWYNFTDNADYMMNYGIRSDYEPNERSFRFAWEKAIQYYKKGLVVTNDPEAKSKMLYMLSLCYKNLGDRQQFREQARAYKANSDTDFYRKRSCMTIEDMQF